MLSKITFRREIKDILLDRFVKGHVDPGARLNLPDIASELEVSVTPIREALTQLTEQGIVAYIPNRGFFLASPTNDELEDLYDTIATLECRAIQVISYTSTDFDKLRAINKELSTSSTSAKRIQSDTEFHQLLIVGSPNRFAKHVVEDIRIRLVIFEHQFMDSNTVDEFVALHEEIISSLESNKLTQAADALRANWELSSRNIHSGKE